VAGEEVMAAKAGDNRELAGLAFLAGCYIAFDCQSTLNSSPWTHETFGQDPAKAESQQWYVRQSIGVSMALGAVGSLIGGSPWPLVGCSIANTYLWWIYRRSYNLATGRS
jgi:hypothetical protein